MLEPGTLALLLAGSAVGTLCLITALHSAVRAGDWNITAVFIIALGWLMNLPDLALAWSGKASFVTDVFGNKLLLHAVANPYFSALRWMLIVIILLTVALAFWRGVSTKWRGIHYITVSALLLHIAIVFSTGLNHGKMFSAAQMGLAAALVVCAVLPTGRGAPLGAGVFGVTLAIFSGLAAAVRPEWAVEPCRDDKCGPLGFLYRGVLGHENALGITLALALPYVYLGFRGKVRFVLTLYVAGMAALTGSRTALIAVTVTILALTILQPRHGTSADWWRLRAAWAIVASGLVTGFVLPMMESYSHTYTGRGYLWSVAYQKVDSAPVIGFGRDALLGLSQEHINPLIYSIHNQLLDTRFMAGWIGFLLFLGILAAMVQNAAGSQRVAMLTVLTAPIYIGITERPWSLAELNGLTFSLLAAILCSAEAMEGRAHHRPTVSSGEVRGLSSLGASDSRHPLTVNRLRMRPHGRMCGRDCGYFGECFLRCGRGGAEQPRKQGEDSQ
ncbi:O-antigen ligase family protein [Streptomyces sp. NPDC001816]|uniref:O-antigen ligase family protein n=1 Tax=Streptomyces sp. NPDC001816 TaxID=3364612 RepID=UPI003684ED1D